MGYVLQMICYRMIATFERNCRGPLAVTILGNVVAILGPSLHEFGVSLVYVRQQLAMLGPSWGYLGVLGLLGSTLGVSWVMLLGLCWGYLGASWGFVINLSIKHTTHIPD